VLSRKSLSRTHVKDRSDIGYPRVKLQRDFIATPVAAVADHGFGSSDLDDNASFRLMSQALP
jgi:hypothetical protein